MQKVLLLCGCRIRPKLTTLHTPSLACLSSSIHSPGFWLASAFPSGAALHNVLSQPVRLILVPPLPNRCPLHADFPSTNCFAARSHVSSAEFSTTPNSSSLVSLAAILAHTHMSCVSTSLVFCLLHIRYSAKVLVHASLSICSIHTHRLYANPEAEATT